MTFAALHQAIQKVMGWEDCHLWTFYIDKTEVGPPQPAGFDFPGSPRPLSAARTTLDAMLSGESSAPWHARKKSGALRRPPIFINAA